MANTCGAAGPKERGTTIPIFSVPQEDPKRQLNGATGGHCHRLRSRIAGGQAPKLRCLSPKNTPFFFRAARGKEYRCLLAVRTPPPGGPSPRPAPFSPYPSARTQCWVFCGTGLGPGAGFLPAPVLVPVLGFCLHWQKGHTYMNMVVIIHLYSADIHVAGVHAANVYMSMETTTMTVANI